MMSFGGKVLQALEGVTIAFDALRANKVRAALTIMGVAIGVFVVVALSSVVRGINESFAKDLEASGPTSFYVFRRDLQAFRNCDGTAETCQDRRNPIIRANEVKTLERLPNILSVTSLLMSGSTFRYKDRVVSANILGFSANWTNVDGGDIYPGRNFTNAEAENAARVVIVNDNMAETLFHDSDPLDKAIYIDGVKFQVIGIYHHTGAPMGSPVSGAGGDSPKAIVPWETGKRSLKFWMAGNRLIVKPRAGVPLEEATDAVTAALRGDRGLRPSQPNNFAIITQDALLKVYDQLFGTFFVVGLALSSVGLLVGGVGVVAIMMISVTERTREIGVRKALGATKGTILWQFLVEAVTMTGLGASVGLIMGLLTATAVRSTWPSIPATTSPGSVMASLVVAAFTGILFGLLPAMKAARLDPVAALRYE
ncbi:MAG TPA: ABC transporter permease [Gemmatimonadaceae bacterium]